MDCRQSMPNVTTLTSVNRIKLVKKMLNHNIRNEGEIRVQRSTLRRRSARMDIEEDERR